MQRVPLLRGGGILPGTASASAAAGQALRVRLRVAGGLGVRGGADARGSRSRVRRWVALLRLLLQHAAAVAAAVTTATVAVAWPTRQLLGRMRCRCV